MNTWKTWKQNVAASVTALLFIVLSGCEQPASPETPSAPEDQPTTPPTPEEPAYVGKYGGTAGRTTVNLDVQADTFKAAAYTEGQAVAARTLSTASADPAVAGWRVLEGTVDSGATVTPKVTAVKDGRGQPLQGEQLAAYTTCDITGPAGDAFRDEVMAGIVGCVGADDAAVTAYELPRSPSELIVGTWDAGLPPGAGGTMEMTISATELSVSSEHTQTCDAPNDWHGSANPLHVGADKVRLSVVEGEAAVVDLVLMRSGAGDDGSRVVVGWRTKPGDAQAGVDYVSGSGKVSYSGGVAKRRIRVATVDDDEAEGDEIFFVELDPEQFEIEHGIGYDWPAALVVIRDDDGVEGGTGACVLAAWSRVFYGADIGDTQVALKHRDNAGGLGGYEYERTGRQPESDAALPYVIDATGNRLGLGLWWWDRRTQ